jgi:Dolichyl-phosphate-mannose-protein mannosyltransferase
MKPHQPARVAGPGAGADCSRVVPVVAGLLFVVLVAYAGRYGYHRDEMYFIVAGSHPAFGYPDQPPLVPLVAWLMHDMVASLYVLRLPSALAAAATVMVTGAIARELGGGRRAQTIAACVAALSAISLATGHFVTTTTFDVLSTSLLGWLLIRAVVRHDPRSLLWAGVVTGVGFEAKPQVGLVAAMSVVALLLVGPRWVFRSRELWAGVVIALVLGAPYLIWQQLHGWPQLTVAHNIAGNSENGRVGFIPFQLVMVSPLLVPVWIAGLVTAWRNPAMRPVRFIPVLFGVLAAAYLVGDGKAYYLASMYPTVIGIGAIPTAAWLARGRKQRLRLASLGLAVVLSVAISAVIALPVLPERDLPGSASIALNPDLGETVGWPQFIDTISSAWHALPPSTRVHAAIFTDNYGEAGAIDVLGGGHGLPHAFSGHNGFSLWSRPRPDQTTTIVIGFNSPQQARPYFTSCHAVAHISNPVHLNNDEYGEPVLRCSGLTAPWSRLWPRLRHYD